MKTLTLKKLTMTNFRGITASVTFHEKGKTMIHGKNGIGKTTILSAWEWIMTGYTDSTSPKNFELFNSKMEVSPETPITKVTAEISIDDRTFCLERQAEAKFTRKKNGSYEKSAADTYKYFIDNIPVNASDYTEWITNNICRYEMLVYCIDGGFFTTLAEEDKNKARKVLEEIIPENDMQDIDKKYPYISDSIKKGYTVEQIKLQQKAILSDIDKGIDKMNAVIESKQTLLDEYNQIDYDSLSIVIDEKKKKIDDIDNILAGNAESIKPLIEKRDKILNQINSKKIKLSELRNAHVSEYNALKSEINGKICRYKQENISITERNNRQKDLLKEKALELKNKKELLHDLSLERERLIYRRDELRKIIFTDSCCPVCGQKFSEDVIMQKKKEFYSNRDIELEEIIKHGKETRRKMDELSQNISYIEEEIKKGINLENIYDISAIEKDLNVPIMEFPAFESTEIYKTIDSEINNLYNQIPSIPENDTNMLTATKKQYIEELEELNRKYGFQEKALELSESINSLNDDINKAYIERVRVEGILNDIAQYIEERAESVSCVINNNLDICKIVMYRMQKDGNLVPDCIVCDNDNIKYQTVNASKRILMKMDLQKMFCEKMDVKMPIFIDEYGLFDSFNAPSPKDNEQMICMYASDSIILNVE